MENSKLGIVSVIIG